MQMNIQDIRPACAHAVSCDTAGYACLRTGTLDTKTAEKLLPDRATLAAVWRYLSSRNETLQETPVCLCRKIVRWWGNPLSLEQMLVCLDIFADVGLLEVRHLQKYISLRLIPTDRKADLTTSRTMQRLITATKG